MGKIENIKRGIRRLIGAAVFLAAVGCADGTDQTGRPEKAAIRETENAVRDSGFAESAGAESVGAVFENAESAGAVSGDAESAGAVSGDAESAGAVSGDAESAGAESAGAVSGDAESADAVPAGTEFTGAESAEAMSERSSAGDPEGRRKEPAVSGNTEEEIDVDLTSLSATMVFSEVYHMMTSPEDYIGKVIRMDGICAVSRDPSSDRVYYACIVQDATACCSQGIEFERRQQGDYPEAGQNICVTGTFDLYREGDRQFATLRNARLE